MNHAEKRDIEYSMFEKESAATSPETPIATASATFSCHDNQTQIARSFCRAPLKIARAFAQPDGGVEVCVMDCSPGMLAGDCYAFDWKLRCNARVSLHNQSFTKVHPSQNAPCRQMQRLVIESGAHCELFLQPTTLFRDASLVSQSEARLKSGATLLFSDIVCAGRQARGESFDFALWQSSWRVFRDEKLIWCNQSRVEPQHFLPSRIGAWNNFAVYGQFLAFDEKLETCSPTLVEMLRAANIEYSNGRLQIGVSALENGGVCASVLGHRAHDVQVAIEKMRLTARAFLER